METLAVVIEKPGAVALRRLGLTPVGAADLLVEIDWSGISTGTEKLLWSGRMPPFPGLGYPLVPGYEAVGRVVDAGADARRFLGQTVFVPGASCYVGARGLFGGSARRLVVPAARVVPVEGLGEEAVLLALAATAMHAIGHGPLPDLVVGHGVLGRLIARIACALGGAPTVWEVDPARAGGAEGYAVCLPEADPRHDYRLVCDASGAPGLLDSLIARLARGGEILLAGFYEAPLSFAFPPAFQREMRLRVAAEFSTEDVARVLDLVRTGRLSLGGLLSHRTPASAVPDAYARAFADRTCLKMLIDWRDAA